MEAIINPEPSSYTQLIKASIKLYRLSFARIIVLSLLLSVVTFIPRLLSFLIGQDLFENISLLSPYQLWILVIYVVALIFFIAILWRMHCVIRGVHEPLIDDFKKGVRKVFYVVIAAIIERFIMLAVTAIIISTLLLAAKQSMPLTNTTNFIMIFSLMAGQFFLLLYVETLFIFYIPLIAIEDNNAFTSLERSMFLGWNHWWSIFTTQITPWIVYTCVLLLIKNILQLDIHIYFFDTAPHNIWATVINIIMFGLYIPWVAALLLLQLKDVELRKKLAMTK